MISHSEVKINNKKYVQANEKHYELMGAANQLAFIRILQAIKLRGLY